MKKSWTKEELYEMYRYNGYSKKDSKAMAERDWNEMHREKTADDWHQTMQEMLYN